MLARNIGKGSILSEAISALSGPKDKNSVSTYMFQGHFVQNYLKIQPLWPLPIIHLCQNVCSVCSVQLVCQGDNIIEY